MKKQVYLSLFSFMLGVFSMHALAQDVADEIVPAEEPDASRPTDIQHYEIRDGDTLWDICKIVLDNPWYWPKLWSLNQYILNPNLINPGQKLAFSPSTDTRYPKMEVVSDEENFAEDMGESTTEVPAETSNIPKFSPKAAADSEFIIEPTAWKRGDTLSVRLRSMTFLSPKDMPTVGKILHSTEPKMELVYGDKIYLNFYKNVPVKIGDKFQVIEKVKMVYDPDREAKKLGWMIRKKAIVVVNHISNETNWRKRVVEATIADADDTVIRGDEITIPEPDIVTLVPHFTDKTIFGKIVEADAEQYLISNNDFVFLNIGEKDGLQPGLQLYVVRTGDGLMPEENTNLPDVTIAKLLIVESHQKTATAYVTTLDRPLAVGDRVRSKVE